MWICIILVPDWSIYVSIYIKSPSIMCLFCLNFALYHNLIDPCNDFLSILTRLVIQLCIWVYLGCLHMNSKVTSLSYWPFILSIMSWIINFLDFQICSFHSSCFLAMLGFHFLALWCTIYGYGGYGILWCFTVSNGLLCCYPQLLTCNKIGRVLEMQIFTLRLQLLMCACRCIISTHWYLLLSSLC